MSWVSLGMRLCWENEVGDYTCTGRVSLEGEPRNET